MAVKHNGKAATIAGGGLSLVAAMMMFATKGEMELIKKRQDETWVAVQNIQTFLMRRAYNQATTNELRALLGGGQ